MQGILGVKKASLFGKNGSSRAGAETSDLSVTQRNGMLEQLNPLNVRLSQPSSKIKQQGFNLKNARKQPQF